MFFKALNFKVHCIQIGIRTIWLKFLAIKTLMVEILANANQFTQVLSASLLFYLDFLLYKCLIH